VGGWDRGQYSMLGGGIPEGGPLERIPENKAATFSAPYVYPSIRPSIQQMCNHPSARSDTKQ
jgi:hypothetical protein